MVAQAVAAAQPPFVLGDWFATVSHRFTNEIVAEAVLAFLNSAECTTAEILTTLKFEDFNEFTVGTARLLTKLIEELEETVYPNKRARKGNAQGALALPLPILLDGVEGGGVAPKASQAKVQYVRFLGGSSWESTSPKEVLCRVREAEVMVRAGDPAQFVYYGLKPRFDGLMCAAKVRQFASEVIATVMSGKSKGESSAICQTLWRLGGISWWTGARVWAEDALLDLFLKGDWDKYDWSLLSLRDFSDGGRFTVSRVKLVDSTFVKLLVGALEGLDKIMVAMFAEEFDEWTKDIRGRLTSGFAGLSTTTQLVLAAMLNDAIADAFAVLGRAERGAEGESLEGPVNVRAHLVKGLASVVLPTLATAGAVGKNFELHRASMYVMDGKVEREAKAAPGSLGGEGAKEGGGKGTGAEEKAVVEVEGALACLTSLRHSLGLKNGLGHPIGECADPKCVRSHHRLISKTKFDWLAAVEKAMKANKTDKKAPWAVELLKAVGASKSFKQ